MTDMTLEKTRLTGGVWEGIITLHRDNGLPPILRITHFDTPLEDFELKAAETTGQWHLRIPIPPELITEGVQTFVIADRDSGEALGSFALLAGDAMAEDIRAEMDMLRAELDMLKRAFRRHCNETMGS